MGANENENAVTSREHYYRTSDLSLATVISLSHAIEEVDRQNPRRAEFCFQQGADLIQLIDSYWNGELRVEPQKFFSQLRTVKARLYGEE